MTAANSGKKNMIVVGGGIAGLTAALRGAELGFQVSVLEQGADELYPCNSRYSGGIIHAAYHDVTRPPDELVDIMRKATASTIDEDLARSIAAHGRRLLSWLQEHDVRFMRFSPLEAHRWCMAPPRPVGPGLDWKGRGPDVMLRTLTQKLRETGGAIVLGARARALKMADGHCVGVTGTQGGKDCEWAADAVVIADGGFQSNLDLFRRYIGPRPERVLQRGAATGRGDGVTMAIEAGAATRGMDRFYGHLHSQDALTNPDVWPYPELDAVAASAIVVSRNGERLLDEGLGGLAIANQIARLDDPASTTLIFNEAIWDGPGKSARFPANPYLERFGGTIRRANTLDELARQTGLPADKLKATVADYNNALKSDALDKLSPPRANGKIKALPIETAPYCAIALCAGITYTMGGIVIDGNGRVLREDKSAIEGVYAAGATTTGVEGGGDGGQIGYVGGLIKAVFGLRAAEHAAETLLQRQAEKMSA
jgi:fumarate reductase flavoprotein subunit